MIKEAVATGATIEEAQQAAVLNLNAPVEADIQFEVISFPEKKKFGIFGGKQAEVRAFYEAEDEVIEEKPVQNSQKKKDTKKKEKKESVKAEKPVEAPKTEELKTESKSEPEEVKAPAVQVALDECPESVLKAYDYLNKIINGIGINTVTIDITRSDKDYFFNIDSEEDYSILIGRRGETLDSIQYLVRLAANRGPSEDAFSKISINIGNYRQKREATLKEIAAKTASKVKKYGRSIALDPMNPFERRIIHTEISNIEDVVSYSVGADADRKVVIALAEGAKPTHQKKPYGGNRGGYNRGGRGRGNGRGYDKAPAPEVPTRAPRSDAEGLSRYGKIEPKE